MPTTSKGLRYPASSDAPNVPQYIQNLAQDADAKFARFTQFTVNWPSSTLAGSQNITTNTITIPAQSGPYALLVSIGIAASMAGTVGCDLRMMINGAQRATFNFADISTTTRTLSGQLSRSFYFATGASTTIFGRLEIPAGTTATTFTDDTNSYVSVVTVTM